MRRDLAQAEHPGEILAEELAARHWSQSDFAHIIGRPAQFVSEIVAGKKEITRESAAQIGAATGQTAEYWLNLQNIWILREQAQNEKTRQDLDDVALRARMNELAPVSYMRKRGYLIGKELPELRREMERLFLIKDINDNPSFPIAARRTNVAEKLSPTQMAWLAWARQSATRLSAADFDKDGLRQLAEQLSRLLKTAEDFQSLPARFAAVGVRLVYVEAFPSSKLDGASFLLHDDPNAPVIALSGRGKRLDKVLFTLLHEIGHLIAGHVLPHRMVLDENAAADAEERQANASATRWALPGELGPVPALVRRGWVDAQAARLGVHPLMVIGQLQHLEKIDWRSALVRDADTVTDALETWGH